MIIRLGLAAVLSFSLAVLIGCSSGGGGGGGWDGDDDVEDVDSNGWIDDDTDDADETGDADEPDSSPSLAASQENAVTVATADAEIERLLKQGVDTRTICTQLADLLEGDARVAGAGVDSGLDAVWVDFIDGESQIFQIIDASSDDEGVIEDDTFVVAKAAAPSRKGAALTGQFNPPNLDDLYHLPANNKALVANALTPFHADWDVTDATNTIDFMLSGVGYDVKKSPLTLDLFDELGDYAVIVLETHGAWRDPAYTADVIRLPASVTDEGDGDSTQDSCRGNGSRHVLLTTTKVTGENLAPRGADMFCGRLMLWNVYLHQPGGKVTKQAYYGVTANYVRQKVTTFPNYTLFVLNACRAWQTDSGTGEVLGPFPDVLFETTEKGAQFFGWDGRVLYPYAYRAILNLFQVATYSNLEETVKTVRILERSEPPWGGWAPDIVGAWNILNEEGYSVDRTGASLQWTSQPPDIVHLLLMPHPHYVQFFEDGHHRLDLLADNAPDVRVGDTPATVTRESGTNTSWKLTLPAGAFGELTVTEDKRIGAIRRTVHRWKPQITITGSWVSGLQYTVTLTLYTRATIDGASLRATPFEDPPRAAFDTEWEKAASFVGWQVTGQQIIDNWPDGVITVKYTGSGQRAFGENDHGRFWTEDGVTAIIDINAEIPYTETRTDSETKEITTSDEAFGLNLYRTDVPLSPSWTVSAQSYTDDIGMGDAQISWNAFGANPAFDAAEEAR